MGRASPRADVTQRAAASGPPRLLIAIPAWNEAANLTDVVGELRRSQGLQAALNILGEALAPLTQGQIYQVPDLAELSEVPPALRVAQVERVRAYAYVPIIVDAELIGLLGLRVRLPISCRSPCSRRGSRIRSGGTLPSWSSAWSSEPPRCRPRWRKPRRCIPSPARRLRRNS